MDRVIFHIDVNSAFLSWSALKIIASGGADIREVPSVVSGDPEYRRSIITAKSIPAKKFGINTADPLSSALRKCPSLVVVPPDFEWYSECSRKFIAICREYSPVLQQFSIDECFLDMTGFLGGADPVQVATRLKDDIHSKLGFTVNVGVGSNKLLAKMASDFTKPDKVHTLWSREVESKMWPLPVRDLLYVGKKTEEKLVHYGISTIGHLAKVNPGTLGSIIGHKASLTLHDYANGVDDSPVEVLTQEAKSYSVERTFKNDVTDYKAMDRALFNLSCTVAHRIRVDGVRALSVSLFVKAKDFSVKSRQCQMERPTDTTAIILRYARTLLPDIWDGFTPIRQAGITLGKLSHDDFDQLFLFEDPQMEYYRKWDEEYDRKAMAEGADPRSKMRKKSRQEDDVPVTEHPSGESALKAAKEAVKKNPDLTFERKPLQDGTDCFILQDHSGKIVGRHVVPGSVAKVPKGNLSLEEEEYRRSIDDAVKKASEKSARRYEQFMELMKKATGK
ncbi:MAG: DNA polymerase IV [Bacteroidales bacterium]|nr:DNA polymerase IV [Bacteroidales bacterium]